ncbi:MAG: MoaD/ThiS family protein [Verrucomicrobia bacterium]|nr:MoaD/ThiS family protein [Verrucomicrobiota bacterium]
MIVRLLFFSVLRDVTGTGEFDLETKPDARVSDILEQLFLRWPKLKDWDASLLVAVDQTYVKRDACLQAGAEVAIMPPVQGG